MEMWTDFQNSFTRRCAER